VAAPDYTEEAWFASSHREARHRGSPEGSQVFYDAENPLAWIQAESVLDLDEVA
jgi:hypothetical protein